MENDVQHWVELEVRELEAELRHQAARYEILERALIAQRNRERDVKNDIRMVELALQKVTNGRIP